jgi:hypothetical protein
MQFILPSDRRANQIVLRGTGPAMHIKTNDKSGKMLIVTKSKTQAVKLNGATNIKFAA